MSPTVSVPVSIVVDDREVPSGLPDLVAGLWTPTYVARLDVADVRIGPDVLVERKTVDDFVASLEDGRLFEQASAMDRIANRPLVVIEGSDALPASGLPAPSLRGILLALTLGFRVPVLRTYSIDETAMLLVQAARRETRRFTDVPKAWRAPRAARVALDVLGAIPSIGDERARRLIERFGSARRVVDASERELRSVDGIGRTIARRIRRLGEEPPPSAGPASPPTSP